MHPRKLEELQKQIDLKRLDRAFMNRIKKMKESEKELFKRLAR